MKPHVKKVHRKIKRNQTYRTLKVGETVRKGDEFKISKDSSTWIPARESVGYKIIINEPGPFRRPIVERKPLSKRQVEKNREAADKEWGCGIAGDEIIENSEEPTSSSKGVKEVRNSFYTEDPPALDIQVDTGKPFEFPPGWGLLETDDPNIKVSLEGERFKWNEAEGRYDRIEPEPIHPDWYNSPYPGAIEKDRKPLVVAIIVFAVVFNAAFLAGYLTRKRLAQPEIQYRDRIEYKTEYSRPMELNGIPDNPWRKAIPILPEDIKITRGGGQWSAGGPVVVVLDEYTAKNLFLALAQALGAPAEKRSHER